MLLPRAALTLALVLGSSAVSAQPTDAARATARNLANEGQNALDTKDFSTAADRFTRAQQIIPAPTIALGLARAQMGLGKWVAAKETLDRIVREGAPAGSPAPYVKAVAEAREDLDALEPRIPSLIIVVKGAASPKVTVDGVPASSAERGGKRLVDPGLHIVRAESAGFVAAQTTVTLGESKVETVTLRLVFGQGQATEDTPPPPATSGTLHRTLGFVGIGVGGASLVMGAVTGGMAIPKHSELSKNCPGSSCPTSETLAEKPAALRLAGFLTMAGCRMMEILRDRAVFPGDAPSRCAFRSGPTALPDGRRL